jgi:hypothetical protein
MRDSESLTFFKAYNLLLCCAGAYSGVSIYVSRNHFFLVSLFAIYSDWTLEQYQLSVSGESGTWMPVALGWEIAGLLWPLLAFAAVSASAATYFIMGKQVRSDEN